MADINIFHYDETYVRIEAIRPILLELYEHFQFFAKNYKFHPKFKAGFWNGKISLLNMKDGRILKGLLPDIVTWCEYSSYSYAISDKVMEGISSYDVSDEKILQIYQRINGPYEPLDSQIDAVKYCLNNGRAIILAPTSNGKSYIIHGVGSVHIKQKEKVLVIIHRSQLVEQLRANLRDEYNGGEMFNYVTSNDKKADIKSSNFYITTWQSCYEKDANWFKQFDVIIGDEVHMFKASSLKSIIDKCGHVKYRYGFTATLDNDSQTDRLTLKGMFGTPHRVATIKELIEQGVVTEPYITAIVLEHSAENKRKIANKKYIDAKEKYRDEIELVENLDVRNDFIISLNRKIDGNTLIAFKHEKHGLELMRKTNNAYYFVNGKIKLANRLQISEDINKLKDSTAIVSIGTFSTGISINSINNIIITCDLLSKITIPQLIGRGMRKAEGKDRVDIYDIGDDLSYNGNDNILFKHFKERLQLYSSLGLKVKIKRIKL